MPWRGEISKVGFEPKMILRPFLDYWICVTLSLSRRLACICLWTPLSKMNRDGIDWIFDIRFYATTYITYYTRTTTIIKSLQFVINPRFPDYVHQKEWFYFLILPFMKTYLLSDCSISWLSMQEVKKILHLLNLIRNAKYLECWHPKCITHFSNLRRSQCSFSHSRLYVRVRV